MRYPLRRDTYSLPPMRLPSRIEEWEGKEDKNKAAGKYWGKSALRSKQSKLSSLENDLHKTI